MTEPEQPPSTIDRQQEPFDQPRSKDARETLRYWLAGSITLVAFSLISALIVVSLRERTPSTADRARIIVQEATITGPLIQHNVPSATIRFKNAGPSPALKIKGRLVMTVWPSKTFPDWEMPLQLTADIEPIGDINPEASMPRTISLISPLTDVQGMHLERRDWFIVILGVVTYGDARKTSHKTNLCLIWSDPSRNTLNPCEKWNEID